MLRIAALGAAGYLGYRLVRSRVEAADRKRRRFVRRRMAADRACEVLI